MVAAVTTQAAFDTSGSNVTPATILSWINEKHREICVRSKYLKETLELGPTVAATPTYAIPTAVAEIRALRLGTASEYLRVNVEQMWALRAVNATLTGPEQGAYAPAFSSGGVQSVEIFPTPTASGTSISALVVAIPPDLTTAPDTAPSIPQDFHEAVVNGAIGMGYLRTDARADLAAPYMADFEAKVALLKRRAVARVGQGPVQFPVAGVHF